MDLPILQRKQAEPAGVEVMRPSIFRGVWWSSIGVFGGWFSYSYIQSDGFDEDAFLLLLMVPFYIGWCLYSAWKAWRLGLAGRSSWALSDDALCWIDASGTTCTVALEDVVALRDRSQPEIDVIGGRGMYTATLDLFGNPMVTPGSPRRLFDELAERLRRLDADVIIVT